MLIDATEDPERRLREATRIAQDTGVPVIAVIEPADLRLIASAADIADFLISPPTAEELLARLTRVSSEPEPSEILGYGDLELNTATYQVTLGGRPVDLTFMEYGAPPIFRGAPRPCVEPRAAAFSRVGVRLLRRRPNGRRPRPAPSCQAG